MKTRGGVHGRAHKQKRVPQGAEEERMRIGNLKSKKVSSWEKLLENSLKLFNWVEDWILGKTKNSMEIQSKKIKEEGCIYSLKIKATVLFGLTVTFKLRFF